MAFSGLSSNKLFTATTLGEDISRVIATLAPIESPVLNWLGDAPVFAISTKHEFIEDFVRPTTIIASAAINSATAATGILINGLGDALTVGTLLENESAAPEVMQITSIVAGGNSILVSRNYDGGGYGSCVAATKLRVRWPAGLEGADHDGSNAQRMGNRRANTVGLLHIPIAASGTALAVNALAGDSFEMNRAKVFQEVPYRLEEAVLTGALNSAASLGSATAYRTMNGVRPQVTTINSQVVVASFAANPAKYILSTWEQVFDAGASQNEEWGLVCGRTSYADICNSNDTKVYDSNTTELYKRVVRRFVGGFGGAEVLLSRALAPTDTLIMPRDRVKVVPLNGRSFAYVEMGQQGDNRKGLVVGEYTVEVHHPSAMGRIRSNG
jgi:hypothetical protein